MKKAYKKLICLKCESKFNVEEAEIKEIIVDHGEDKVYAVYICPYCNDKTRQEMKPEEDFITKGN